MISDKQTNTIYFSELLKTDKRFSEASYRIFSVLKTFGVKPKFLPKTNDIWARDYMPVQVSESKFVEYRYDPDYLQGHYKNKRNLKTYQDIVCDSIGIKTVKSNIILDGGNLIKSADCIILTDKIVKENRHFYTRTELINKLRETFEVDKVILIPWDKKNDKYGHADGMLRFIDNETVLVSHFYQNDTALLSRLKEAGLKYEFLKIKVKKNHKFNWAYINFLQTKDLILLPEIGADEDEQTFAKIEEFYPEYKNRIAGVNLNEVIEFHGALNCITWTIKE
jgi:agmatine deiminase